MRRKKLDVILTSAGIVVTAVLVIAGGLLMWGSNFANTTVHDQLAQQQIYFPAAGSPALADTQIGPYLNQYAGQQLVTGQQAEAYADHFIAVHLDKVAGGKTYAQVSAAALASPTNAALKGQEQTIFQGTTLRGLLLQAYAFSIFGQIAMWAGIGAFVAAGIMVVLVALGMVHTRRVSEDILVGGVHLAAA